VQPPQGYLTLATGLIVPTTDQVNVSQIFYTVDKGNSVPIFNGFEWVSLVFGADLSLQLNQTFHTVNNAFDVFAINAGGTLTLVSGPAWTANTTSPARATALARQNGIYTNATSFTGVNGPFTGATTNYTVPAFQGTYLGSFNTTTAGGTTCHVGAGLNRIWGIWNAYNRRFTMLKSSDATSSWTYGTNAWRTSDAGNLSAGQFTNASIVIGLAEDRIRGIFMQRVQVVTPVSGGGGSTALLGIGIDSTSVPSGYQGTVSTTTGLTTAGNTVVASGLAEVTVTVPVIGFHTYYALENGTGGAGNTFIGGGEGGMVLITEHLG
jgi:hypothetical protein